MDYEVHQRKAKSRQNSKYGQKANIWSKLLLRYMITNIFKVKINVTNDSVFKM